MLSAKWTFKDKHSLKFTTDTTKPDATFFACHVKTKATIHKHSARHKFNRDYKQGKLYLNNGLNEEIISIRLI